ncbi:MAG TPA: hypothetical protein PKA60_03045 [Candidatus Paceibacterota bacterium]|nr:hypothetical protein [Candidatus Paceibacterota bacterium]
MFEDQTKKVDVVKMPQALEKAKEIMAEYKIDPESFSDLYNPSSVNDDKKYVAEMKIKFDLQNTEQYEVINNQLAEIFEAIIFDEGESANWFGDNSFLIKTSDYDDIKNGVDMVVEYDEDEGVSRIAAAIDVTFSHLVGKKIDRIKNDILSGNLGQIKYFTSEVSNMRGELKKIPRIIIGADVDSVRGLANDWVEKKSDYFAKHPIQFQIFEQAIFQCEYFAKFAAENGQEEIAIAYEKMKEVLERNRDNRESDIGNDPKIRDSFMTDFLKYFE